jgi:hypothetical protein
MDRGGMNPVSSVKGVGGHAYNLRGLAGKPAAKQLVNTEAKLG